MTIPTAVHAIDLVRQVRPTTHRQLWQWVHSFTGVQISTKSVCRGHAAPFTLFARQVLERPSLALWHGPRGSGKSFLSAIDTHIASRFNPRHGTRILGGSLAQSEQIYQALEEAILSGHGRYGSDADTLSRFLKNEVFYHNGSHISILAASPTSVRGPHVASLKLDEIDEIEPEIREAAMGMAMEKHGCTASVLMTSTWHRVAGPMAELIDRGRAGAFPVDTFCIFEVLERCPEERSGPRLERCPECPLVRWCHSDRDLDPKGLPKAKRSSGHYTIDSLIQKVNAVSARVFESDYLCLRPKAAGVWFTMFDEPLHVTDAAGYDPRLPVHLAIDPGVHTGAVWFQVRPRVDGRGHKVNIFADYFAEGVSAESNATAIRRRSEQLCGIGLSRARVSMDPSGDARTAVGPTVRGEYERAGCKGRDGLESWPSGKKVDGLNLVEALLKSADQTTNLTIHPRCRHLISAMQSYTRARRANQWMDYAEDPQHPHEDLIDPLCGGLKLQFPEGRAPAPSLRTVDARNC
jgi:hypothetical protein